MNDPKTPFENGDPDRDQRGRFRVGWRGGPGSPGAKHAVELRRRLDEALHVVCSQDRLVTTVDSILRLAEAGDVQAAKLVFERIAGPPVSREIAERLDALEARLLEVPNEHS
jgi:hypothetical protein